MSQKNGFDTNNYFVLSSCFQHDWLTLVDLNEAFLKGGEVKLPKPAWLWTSMIIAAFTTIIIFAIAIVIVHGGSQDPIVRNQAAFP